MNTPVLPELPSTQGHPLLRRTRWLAWAVAALLLGGAGLRGYVNAMQAETVRHTTASNAPKSVLVTQARPGQAQRQLALPATLRGRNEAAIYARTNGYVRAWQKDIGDKVRKGDTLALIDTPEVDQDLAQARATQEQIKARLALTQTSLARWEGLRERDAVSQQELDERRAAQQQAQADLAASKANVARLQQLHDFGRITAPFDGVVVRRNVDVGTLVTAGSSNARELFYLAQTNPLQVLVSVPQVDAASVSVGQSVDIRRLEQPGAPAQGKVTRIAGGVDVATRSVQVEIALDNPGGDFLPGAYVEVGIALRGAAKALLLPPNALQFRQDGPRVAVVGADQKISVRKIKLGRDLGRAVEVLAGLSPQDKVVLNPPDTLLEGEQVLAQQAPEAKPEGAGRGAARPASAASGPAADKPAVGKAAPDQAAPNQAAAGGKA
jgi:RND family efflux transporter MFP subunit